MPIHQPLHAVSRFSRDLPQGDEGGNRVQLCNLPCREQLHFFCDQALGHGTPTAALALARRVVYATPVGAGSAPYALTAAYRDRARIVARERIALAGRRLAVLLNNALAPDESARSPPVSGSTSTPGGKRRESLQESACGASTGSVVCDAAPRLRADQQRQTVEKYHGALMHCDSGSPTFAQGAYHTHVFSFCAP